MRFLRWPAQTLRALELLQEEEFRRDVLGEGVVGRLGEEVGKGFDGG